MLQANVASQPTKTYVIGPFATTLFNDGTSTTIQALSPNKIKVFEPLADSSYWLRIFCGGYKKPIVYNSLSVDSTKSIVQENALQDELLYALGVWLTPLLPVLDYEDVNWHNSMDAWAVLYRDGKKIDVGKAIELVNHIAKTVGVRCDENLSAHTPAELFNYVDRMSQRKKIANRWRTHYRCKRAELNSQQIRSFLTC